MRRAVALQPQAWHTSPNPPVGASSRRCRAKWWARGTTDERAIHTAEVQCTDGRRTKQEAAGRGHA